MIDAHLHLCDDKLYPEADTLVQEALALGLEQFLCIVTCETELARAVELKAKYPMIKIGASTTPHEAFTELDPFFKQVEKAAYSGVIEAIGETGLEYFHPGMDKQQQKRYLQAYVELALATDLPLIFHCREAFSDLFEILGPFKGQLRGMIHCFSGSYEEALKAIDLGLCISISGIVTFKKSLSLQQTLACLPLESLLIETDSPYLAPLSFRGKINTPSYIIETYQKVAELKNIPLEGLKSHVRDNFERIF